MEDRRGKEYEKNERKWKRTRKDEERARVREGEKNRDLNIPPPTPIPDLTSSFASVKLKGIYTNP